MQYLIHYLQLKNVFAKNTLEPLIKVHLWDQTFCLINRGVPYLESQ